MNETELLFTEILNCNRQDLYLNKETFLDKAKASLISKALRRRLQGEPLQYILGKTEFMGLEFKVTPDVFIPRPETEILVEAVIDYAYRLSPMAHCVLELGTGSGCIAISLAKYLSGFNITATDISRAALNIAKENAETNNVIDKITFLKSNLFESLAIPACPAGGCDMRYAICVCNPPYIPTQEIEKLQPEIRYEPAIALDGGKDGLDFYRRIIKEAPCFLREGGFLVMEMGFNQCMSIKEIFRLSGKFEIIDAIKDYNGIERVIVARVKRKVS